MYWFKHPSLVLGHGHSAIFVRLVLKKANRKKNNWCDFDLFKKKNMCHLQNVFPQNFHIHYIIWKSIKRSYANSKRRLILSNDERRTYLFFKKEMTYNFGLVTSPGINFLFKERTKFICVNLCLALHWNQHLEQSQFHSFGILVSSSPSSF